MGRKSKRKSNATPDETSRSDRKEILRLCGQIIELAATQSPPTPAEQFEEFLKINSLVEKIRKKQHDAHLQVTQREAHFEEFFAWLNTHGVPTDSFKLHQFEEGYGLQATRDIQMDEELMCIPRKLIMSDQNAVESNLGELIKGDRLLKGMPNISLAVFLISEKLKADSFWKPYINILPSCYTIPLYYSPAELQLMQGSPVYSDSLKQHKNIARQYAYLYKVLNQAENSKLHAQLRDHFTYDIYRWAVATVMSRQNQIPSPDNMGVSLALIPLWDMCNHTNGEMKTDYNRERDACINLALRDFGADEQIYLCYGRRTNGDLLLYSGFVPPSNDYDGTTIQLGLSSGDRLYAMKAQLCSVMRLAVPSQNYNITNSSDPVSLELLTFLRIFCMAEDDLKERLLGEDRKQMLFKLVYKNLIVSKLNELRTCVYLATRVNLLLRQYKSSIEEDEEKLKDKSLSFQERCITQLLLSEKCILENVLHHCTLWRERADNLPDDATSYTPAQKGEEEEGTDTAEKWEDRDEEEEEEVEAEKEENKAKVNSVENGESMNVPEECNQNGADGSCNGGSKDVEKPKANGDAVSANGNGVTTSPGNGQELLGDEIITDEQSKSLKGDINDNMGALKAKLNGGATELTSSEGEHISNGNGAHPDIRDNGRTGAENGSKGDKSNGHITAVPTNISTEE